MTCIFLVVATALIVTALRGYYPLTSYLLALMVSIIWTRTITEKLTIREDSITLSIFGRKRTVRTSAVRVRRFGRSGYVIDVVNDRSLVFIQFIERPTEFQRYLNHIVQSQVSAKA